jgi:predicted Zn-dependent peptidase
MEVKIYNIKINDLNILLIPMDNTEIVSVGMFIKIGSINETKDNNGMAHFLEHLMFKSTFKRPNKQLLNSLDNLGTHYNAGTTRDHTYYEINGNKKDIEQIIDIMLDLYLNPVYESDEIELEKGVILEELKMYQDNITRTLFDYIISQIFKGTPLERPIIGTEFNIKKFTKDDVTDFRQLYTIENSLLVIAGNFEKNNVIKIIKDSIKDTKFNHSKNDEPIITYSINKSTKPGIYIIPNQSQSQSYLFLSFYFDKLSKEEMIILKFISYYLSSGSTSKLFEVLRNKLGASYSNESDLINFRCENGLFYIYCNINNTLILESLKEILNILRELKHKDISKEDLKKVKKIFETSNLFHINNSNHIMLYHGRNYLFGKNENILEECNFFSKLDGNTIKDFCNIFFIKKTMNLFIFGNDIDQSSVAKVVNDF